jgi:hypothetical protein
VSATRPTRLRDASLPTTLCWPIAVCLPRCLPLLGRRRTRAPVLGCPSQHRCRQSQPAGRPEATPSTHYWRNDPRLDQRCSGSRNPDEGTPPCPVCGVPREAGQCAAQSRERWAGGGERRRGSCLCCLLSLTQQPLLLCSPLGLPRQDYRVTHPARCACERGGAGRFLLGRSGVTVPPPTARLACLGLTPPLLGPPTVKKNRLAAVACCPRHCCSGGRSRARPRATREGRAGRAEPVCGIGRAARPSPAGHVRQGTRSYRGPEAPGGALRPTRVGVAVVVVSEMGEPTWPFWPRRRVPASPAP